MTLRLYVNVDHVATVRQARRTNEPDPVRAAVLAELGGADGITVHLREDRRHIQDRDLQLLMSTVRTGVNLELATASDVLDQALAWRPMAVTIVPEQRLEITTEGGLDLSDATQRTAIAAAVQRLRDVSIRTSLFVDPDAGVIRNAGHLGAHAVELHTGEFAEAWKAERAPHAAASVRQQVDRLCRAAELARSAGMAVHAGHGLTYENVSCVADLHAIEELNIGHSIVSRALLVGMEAAVREMKRIVLQARAQARALPE